MVWKLIVLCGAAAALYLIPLWLFRDDLLHLLYRGRYQTSSALPVMLTGLLPLASTATVILGSALRATERPRQIFWCYTVFTLTAAVIGVPLAVQRGLIGALIGMLVSYVVLAMAMLVPYAGAWRADGGSAEL
jgi:O-antigen/teichoic acid export membrane protein